MELLVRIVDKVSNSKVDNLLLTKRGDVIASMPDGHDWTPRERENSEWRIIKLPGMSEEAAEIFIVPQKPLDLTNKYVLALRAVRIDLDALPVPFDPTEKRDDDLYVSLKGSDVLAAAMAKPLPKTELEVLDAVIGPKSSNIIGPA